MSKKFKYIYFKQKKIPHAAWSLRSGPPQGRQEGGDQAQHDADVEAGRQNQGSMPSAWDQMDSVKIY